MHPSGHKSSVFSLMLVHMDNALDIAVSLLFCAASFHFLLIVSSLHTHRDRK